MTFEIEVSAMKPLS